MFATAVFYFWVVGAQVGDGIDDFNLHARVGIVGYRGE